MSTARGLVGLAVVAALLVAAAVWAAVVGPVSIPVGDVLGMLVGAEPAESRHGVIVWSVRLPRIALGALVGAGLASGGASLQGLFRNPLADPYVLGIASGAGLGAACVLLAAGRGEVAPGWVPIGGFIGAATASLVVHGLAWRGGRLPLTSVLLAGVAVGLVGSAGVSLVLVLAESRAGDIVGWLLGDLGGHGWSEVGWVAACVLPALVMLLAMTRRLDALLLGEASAASLGVDVLRTKLWVLLAVSLSVGGAVAFCGFIGFVGLIVPHAVRMLVGGRHRWLVPVSAVGGAAVLVAADTVARIAMPDRALPVGVVTGCVGGPFFLWLLRSRLP